MTGTETDLPRRGDVYARPNGKESIVVTDPTPGRAAALYVDIVTDRGSRIRVDQLLRFERIGRGVCFRCWRTGDALTHTPDPRDLDDHTERLRRSARLYRRWAEDEQRDARVRARFAAGAERLEAALTALGAGEAQRPAAAG